MGYLSAKAEGNQFFKHVPHFRDFTRSSGTFSLKTCVAVHIFSRKISGLLRSLSVGILTCRASLIKHLLIISLSSFTSLYNSARRAKSRLRKRNSDRHSSPSKSSKLKSGKESQGWARLLDRFKSCKSGSSSWFRTPSLWLIKSDFELLSVKSS